MLIRICTILYKQEQAFSGETAASYKTTPQGTSFFLIFVLALLANGISTDEEIVLCCSTGNYSNIDDVLKHAQSMNGTIAIRIQTGNYSYTLSGSYQFQNKSEISII